MGVCMTWPMPHIQNGQITSSPPSTAGRLKTARRASNFFQFTCLFNSRCSATEATITGRNSRVAWWAAMPVAINMIASAPLSHWPVLRNSARAAAQNSAISVAVRVGSWPNA